MSHINLFLFKFVWVMVRRSSESDDKNTDKKAEGFWLPWLDSR